jgi:DNA-directed RNA polymerase specialized sigma24 family protein
MRHRADLELTQRVVRGEAAGFQAFFADVFPRVYAFAARRTRSAQAAELVTERALVRAFAALGDYAGSVPLSGWLLGFVKQELRAEVCRSPDAALSQGAPPGPAA